MTFKKGWRRFARIWQSDTVARVDEELGFHFEHKVAELEALGLSTAQARARAEDEFGDVAVTKDSLRAIDRRMVYKQQRAQSWDSVAQDLRYVVRALRRSPVFTATVVVTLALGLGANTAIFSILNRLYWQTPVGVPKANELYRVYDRFRSRSALLTMAAFDHPMLLRLQDVAPPGVRIAGYTLDQRRIGHGLDDPTVQANFVVGDYFGVVGVRPSRGRFFSADESDIRRTDLVAVISEHLWSTRFGGDPDIIGKQIDVGSHRHTIIGVTGGGFRGVELNATDVWVPRGTQGKLRDRAADWYEQLVGVTNMRLISRVSSPALVHEFDLRATQGVRAMSKRDTSSLIFLGSIIDARVSDSRKSELAISTRLGGVAIVILLIACANVVNLLLARASVRQREIALRLALGVSRRRLIMQLITESGVLAFVSGIAALAVAYVATNTLQHLLLPGVEWSVGAIDSRVIAFTFAMTLLTGFVAGLIPALQLTNPNLSGALKSSVRDGGARRSKLRSGLLVAQAALSVVLLAGAGVFVKSMQGVEAIDVGYDTSQLAFAQIGYDHELENRSAEIAARMPEVAERLQRIPGVEHVGLTDVTPMNGVSFGQLFLPDRDSLPGGRRETPFRYVVSPEFFRTVGIRALRGRVLNDSDKFGTEPVIVINQALAESLWPGEDALQKCIIFQKRQNACRRVVGVVSNAHVDTYLEKNAARLYYLPFAQLAPDFLPDVIAVRVMPGASVGSVSATVKRELAAAYGAWARPEITLMEDVVAPDLRPWRVGAQLFTAAGLLALLVAAVGVYSSMAYTISQRTQEMGVRVALGAATQDIVRLVLQEGVRVVMLGVAIGVVVALALGSLVAAMLYNTSPRDPGVLVTSTAVLLVVAMLACLIPAWRASRVDPLTALRAE
ncbi:MAG: ADOP family duplicated permease [Gemmatimonas sp.]